MPSLLNQILQFSTCHIRQLVQNDLYSFKYISPYIHVILYQNLHLLEKSESLFLTNKLLKYDFHVLSIKRLLCCRQFVNNK
jgi:hypothetical protein